MSGMFELCRLRCKHVELHASSSFGLNELLISYSTSFHLAQCFTIHRIVRKTKYFSSNPSRVYESHKCWLIPIDFGINTYCPDVAQTILPQVAGLNTKYSPGSSLIWGVWFLDFHQHLILKIVKVQICQPFLLSIMKQH